MLFTAGMMMLVAGSCGTAEQGWKKRDDNFTWLWFWVQLSASVLFSLLLTLNYNLRLQFLFYQKLYSFLIDSDSGSGEFKNKIFINNFLIFYLYNLITSKLIVKLTPFCVSPEWTLQHAVDFLALSGFKKCSFIIILRLCTYLIYL